MQRISCVQPAVTNTGTYCTLQADLGKAVLPGNIIYHGGIFAATTINIVAGTGVTAGTLQPLVMMTDGVLRNYGAAISLTAAGAQPLIQITTPILGAAVQVTVAIVGGSIAIDITAVVL